MRSLIQLSRLLLAFAATLSLAHAQEGAVTFAKGPGAREVQVTVKNGDRVCGLQIQFSDGRTERRRMEPGEAWRVSHTAAVDGKLAIQVEGLSAIRGPRALPACSYAGTAAFMLGESNAGLPVAGVPAGAPAARGAQSGLVVYSLMEFRNQYTVSTLDGGIKIANPEELARRGVTVCIVTQANGLMGIPDDAINGAASSEFVRYLAGLAGGKQFPLR